MLNGQWKLGSQVGREPELAEIERLLSRGVSSSRGSATFAGDARASARRARPAADREVLLVRTVIEVSRRSRPPGRLCDLVGMICQRHAWSDKKAVMVWRRPSSG